MAVTMNCRFLLQFNVLFTVYVDPEEVVEAVNLDWEGIITPVKPDVLEHYLKMSRFDENQTQFLVQGF